MFKILFLCVRPHLEVGGAERKKAQILIEVIEQRAKPSFPNTVDTNSMLTRCIVVKSAIVF